MIRRSCGFVATIAVTAYITCQISFHLSRYAALLEHPWQSLGLLVVVLVAAGLLIGLLAATPTRPRMFLFGVLSVGAFVWGLKILHGIHWGTLVTLFGGLVLLVALWFFAVFTRRRPRNERRSSWITRTYRRARTSWRERNFTPPADPSAQSTPPTAPAGVPAAERPAPVRHTASGSAPARPVPQPRRDETRRPDRHPAPADLDSHWSDPAPARPVPGTYPEPRRPEEGFRREDFAPRWAEETDPDELRFDRTADRR